MEKYFNTLEKEYSLEQFNDDEIKEAYLLYNDMKNHSPNSSETLLSAISLLNLLAYYYTDNSKGKKAKSLFDLNCNLNNENKFSKSDVKIVDEILGSYLGKIELMFLNPKMSEIKTIVEEIKILEEYTNNYEIISELNNNIGIYYFKEAEFEKAIQYFSNNEELSKRTNNRLGTIKAIGNIANANIAQYKYEEALNSFNKLMNMLDIEDTKDKKFIGTCYKNIGEIYYKQNEYDNALKYYKLKAKISIELNDELGTAIAYNSIGSVYQYKNHLSSAKGFYTKALTILGKLGETDESEKIIGNLALIYYEEKDYDRSEQLLIKKYNLAKKSENIGSYPYIFENLALIYKDKNDIPKTIEYLKKQLKYAKKSKDISLKISALSNLLSIKRELGMFDDAMQIANKLILLAKKIKENESVISGYNGIANIMIENKEFESALQFTQKSLDLGKKINLTPSILASEFIIAKIYCRTNKINESKEKWDILYSKAIEAGMEDLLYDLKTLEVEIWIKNPLEIDRILEIKNRFLYILEKDQSVLQNQERQANIYFNLWQISKVIFSFGKSDKEEINKYKNIAVKLYAELISKIKKYSYTENLNELNKN